MLLISIWRCPFGLLYFTINVNGPNDCQDGEEEEKKTKIIRKSLSIPSPMFVERSVNCKCSHSIDDSLNIHENGCEFQSIMAIVHIKSVPKIVARKLFNASAKRILNSDICWDLLPVDYTHSKTYIQTNKQNWMIFETNTNQIVTVSDTIKSICIKPNLSGEQERKSRNRF